MGHVDMWPFLDSSPGHVSLTLFPTQPRSDGDWVVSPPTHDGLYAIVGQVPGWRCISPSCLGHEQSIAAKASITHGKGWVGGQSSLRAMKLVICKMQSPANKAYQHIASKIYPTVLANLDSDSKH